MYSEEEVQKMINDEIKKIKPVSPRHQTEPEIQNFNSGQKYNKPYEYEETRNP